MTTIQLSVEGPFAQEVVSDILSDLSFEESSSVTVAIQFEEGFALSAEGDSITTAAERFNAISYNQDPVRFDVDIEMTEPEAAVETVPSTSDALTSAEEEDDVDEAPEPEPTGVEGYSDGAQKLGRPHSVDNPAHLTENTMEHLTLGLMAEYLRHTEDVDSAFDATDVMVDPDEFRSWDRAAVTLTESQVTNALYRLWKKGLVERDRGAVRNSRTYGYELNRAGAAEIERVGRVDPDEFAFSFDDNSDE